MGTPLPGASVSVAGTSVTTITDARGEYYLANVPVGPQEVVVSSVGYGEKRSRVDVGTVATAQQDFRLDSDVVELGAFV